MTEATTQSNGKGLGRKVIAATVAAVLIFAALSFYGDVQELADNLRAFDVVALVWAFVLATGNYLLRFVRWHYYLHGRNLRLPLGESGLVFTAGFVMSVTPGKVGELLKSWLLQDLRGFAVARTAPLILAERITDLAAIVLLTAIGSLAFVRGVPLALAGGGVVVLLLAGISWRRLGEGMIDLVERLPWIGRIAPRLHVAYDALHGVTRPLPLALGTLVGVVSWFLECLALHVVVRGFPGASLDLASSIFAYSVPIVAGSLTLLPGGLGATEAGMTGALQALGDSGVTRAVATATTILVRIATLWWAVALGMGALALLRRRPRPVTAQ